MKKDTIKWFSQCGQDKFVAENLFNLKENGNFVEVGAHDGVALSNTWVLERYLSWSGVCIEPSSRSTDIVNRRKKSKVFNYCASPRRFENQLVRLREYVNREISHTIFEDLYDPPHYAKKIETKGKEYWDRLKKCKTLDSILVESDIKNDIDYISIDTQGSEWMIMEDFTFDKWNVKVLTIANDMYVGGEKKRNRKKIKSLMEDNGYKLERVFTLNELDRKNWGKDFKDRIIEDMYVKQDN